MVGISLREMNPLAEREVYRTRDVPLVCVLIRG